MTELLTKTSPAAAGPDLLAAHFTAGAKSLLAALAAVGPCVPRRSPKPVLRNVALRARAAGSGEPSTLAATDLELAARVTLEGVHADRPVDVLLPHDRVTAVLAAARQGDVRFEVGESSMTLRGQGFTVTLPTEPFDTYPDVEFAAGGGFHAVPAAVLRELIQRVRYATDTQSDRYALGGALLELSGDAPDVALVATDGRRLAKASAGAGVSDGGGVPADFKSQPVIPLKALGMLAGLAGDEPVELRVRGNMVHAASGGRAVASRLVEGRFPKYADVFPSGVPVRVAVRSGELLDAVSLAATVSSVESHGINFSLDTGRLTLRATTADTGSSEVELAVNADAVSGLAFTLDGRYLRDALAAVGPDLDLTMEVRDAKLPVVFRSDAVRGEDGAVTAAEGAWTYVVMPLTTAREARFVPTRLNPSRDAEGPRGATGPGGGPGAPGP